MFPMLNSLDTFVTCRNIDLARYYTEKQQQADPLLNHSIIARNIEIHA